MTTQPQDESVVTQAVKSALPWRTGIRWWLVLVEGIVLAGVGLYMLISPTSSAGLLATIVAGTLGVIGLLELVGALRNAPSGLVGQLMLLNGAVGLIIGLLLFILLFAGALTVDAGRIILLLGCLAFGLLSGYRLYLTRAGGLARGALVTSVFFIVVGLLLLLSALGVGAITTTVRLIAILSIAAGLFLIVWAFVIRNRTSKAATSD